MTLLLRARNKQHVAVTAAAICCVLGRCFDCRCELLSAQSCSRVACAVLRCGAPACAQLLSCSVQIISAKHSWRLQVPAPRA